MNQISHKRSCRQNGLRVIISLLLLGISAYGCAQTNSQEVREPAVAGSFYPTDSLALTNMLEALFASAERLKTQDEVWAVLAPHAGYFYSGQVAASAYTQIDAFKVGQTVFLLGTSHRHQFPGVSVYCGKAYQTPLGLVPVNQEIATSLCKQSPLFQYYMQVHEMEHSLEVQLPFLQYKMQKPFRIVPILFGERDYRQLQTIAEILQPYFTADNLFVLSTDFSHYPSYQDAKMVDKHVGAAVLSCAPHKLVNALNEAGSMNIANLQTSMCGWPSVLSFLYLLQATDGIQAMGVAYQNSGDASGDHSRVVGYHAMIFTKNKETMDTSDNRFELTKTEQKELLALARATIKERLLQGAYTAKKEDEVSENLRQTAGAFVTLHIDGALRGCIGQFSGNAPLYQVVQKMAVAAALKDNRFPPLTSDELQHVDLEISVLTPMRKIQDLEELQLGKHGVYIKKGFATGTFLPQVATETGWTKEEFLGHCARDKAGIGWDGWKQAELFVYEAFVFHE